MILYHSEELDAGAEKVWTDVTTETIQNSVATMVGVDADLVEVTVTLENKELIVSDPLRMLTLSTARSNDVKYAPLIDWHNVVQHVEDDGPLRKLQSLSETARSPLAINFITTIKFPSDRDDWNKEDLVGSGFVTSDQQDAYLALLKGESPDYFNELESMTMEVEGNLVTEPAEETAVPDDPTTGEGNNNNNNGDEDANGSKGPSKVEGPDGEGGNTTYIIIASAVGGACLLIFAGAITVYYGTRRKRNNQKESASTFQSPPSITGQPQHEQQHQPEILAFRNGAEIEAQTMEESNDAETGLCFGTIESREGGDDDISTIGDPYFGDAPNAVMDADNTVGESMVSSQQERYVYGIQKGHLGTEGSTRGGGSTINGGTIASRAMYFRDDTTLEDIYNTPDGGREAQSSPIFKRITVAAGAGKLGIVLDNPHGDLPLVHAIKETSPLHGKIRVGDLLLSVDEVDCRGMLAHDLSAFLTSRSQNRTRTLVLARGTGPLNVSV